MTPTKLTKVHETGDFFLSSREPRWRFQVKADSLASFVGDPHILDFCCVMRNCSGKTTTPGVLRNWVAGAQGPVQQIRATCEHRFVCW